MASNTKTDGNLKTAFAGESQANRRYLFFAEKADNEGHPQIARLFRAAAAAETVHPAFIKEAEKENNVKATVSFGRANSVEKIHHGLFEAALKALEAKQPLKAEDYYVCGVCGYTVAGEAPDKCPICGALRVLFAKVD